MAQGRIQTDNDIWDLIVRMSHIDLFADEMPACMEQRLLDTSLSMMRALFADKSVDMPNGKFLEAAEELLREECDFDDAAGCDALLALVSCGTFDFGIFDELGYSGYLDAIKKKDVECMEHLRTLLLDYAHLWESLVSRDKSAISISSFWDYAMKRILSDEVPPEDMYLQCLREALDGMSVHELYEHYLQEHDDVSCMFDSVSKGVPVEDVLA